MLCFFFKKFQYNVTGPFLPLRSLFQHPLRLTLIVLTFKFFSFFFSLLSSLFHIAQNLIRATPKVQTTDYLKSWFDIYPDSCWKNVLNLQVWWQMLLPAEISNWPEKEIQYMVMKCKYFEFRLDYTRRSKGMFSSTCHDSVFLVKTEL